MAKYRKKPVVVEAQLYTHGMEDGYVQDSTDMDDVKQIPVINTLEGQMIVSPGDYIITGIKGERYPCKPDIFEATYELVDVVNSEISTSVVVDTEQMVHVRIAGIGGMTLTSDQARELRDALDVFPEEDDDGRVAQFTTIK